MMFGQQGPQERRSERRFPFAAQVTLTEAVSGTRMFLVTRDLSETGCWLNLINPFPLGTRVVVEISTVEGIVNARATVTRREYGGMGIAFCGLELLSVAKLRRCLLASEMPIFKGSK